MVTNDLCIIGTAHGISISDGREKVPISIRCCLDTNSSDLHFLIGETMADYRETTTQQTITIILGYGVPSCCYMQGECDEKATHILIHRNDLNHTTIGSDGTIFVTEICPVCEEHIEDFGGSKFYVIGRI
jgi:hypothetical protein